jgi:hypothetical protein
MGFVKEMIDVNEAKVRFVGRTEQVAERAVCLKEQGIRKCLKLSRLNFAVSSSTGREVAGGEA